jgi:hypothetical protein
MVQLEIFLVISDLGMRNVRSRRTQNCFVTYKGLGLALQISLSLTHTLSVPDIPWLMFFFKDEKSVFFNQFCKFIEGAFRQLELALASGFLRVSQIHSSPHCFVGGPSSQVTSAWLG